MRDFAGTSGDGLELHSLGVAKAGRAEPRLLPRLLHPPQTERSNHLVQPHSAAAIGSVRAAGGRLEIPRHVQRSDTRGRAGEQGQ